jgi:hypothetical protein
MPVTESESWTVLGTDGVPLEPVESFLTYLVALERSPNTQRAYATSLRLWFEFLDAVDVDWADVVVDDVARFVSWLRAPAPNVIVLDGGTARRSPATVNRHLTAVFGFYEHHARSGVKVAAGLVAWRRIGRGSYKPFLHHATRGRPIATRPVKLPVPQRAPRTLTAEQVVQVLTAPVRARDRFLLALLAETGMLVVRPSGCGTPTSSAAPRRSGSCPEPTTRTAPERSCARRRRSRSPPGWSAATRTTCTPSTATSTRTMCS